MSIVEWKIAQINMLALDELYNQVNKILPVNRLNTHPTIPKISIEEYPGL